MSIFFQAAKTPLGIKGRDGEKISPSMKYEQGMGGVDGRMVGKPRIPENWDQLRYQLLPSKERGLHRYGIHIHNRKYQASIITSLRSEKENAGKKFLVRYDHSSDRVM